MTNTDRRGRFRRPAKALAALAIAAGAFTGLGLAGPAPAASAAECPMGLLLANAPSKDMALGFANGTTNNAPLSIRDSSGLSRAEMWFEIPGPFGTVLLQNVNTDTGTFYAAVSGQAAGLAVVTKTKSSPNSFDPSMAWKKRVEGGTITYTNLSSSKLITNVAGNEGIGGKPFQQFFSGQGGAQKFVQDTRNC